MIFRDFWKTRSFKNFLFHPCEEQNNKLKQQKHREEREIRAIYPTKNILQIQVFRWYEKLIRNLAQIQSWRFLCTGRGWTLIKVKKKTLFYYLELSVSMNSADYFIIMMVLFTSCFYMFVYSYYNDKIFWKQIYSLHSSPVAHPAKACPGSLAWSN